MHINDTHFTAPRKDTDEAVEFDEEFDRLLAESSVGAPNARAVRQLADEAKVDKMLDRTDEVGDEISHGDADTALLALVRAAASDFTARSTSEPEVRSCVQQWPLGAGASLGMLTHLAEVDVFRYVHRDIARLVLDTVLRMNVPQLLARLTNGAIESSRIGDDVMEELLPLDVDCHNCDETGEGPARAPERIRAITPEDPLPFTGTTEVDSTQRAGFDYHPTGAGKSSHTPLVLMQLKPHGEVRTRGVRDRVVTEQDRLDELMETLTQFIKRSIALVITGADKQAPPMPSVDRRLVVDQVDALILAPLYEGSKNTEELESTVRFHLGLHDLPAAEFKERLHHLYRNRLIGKAGRPYGPRSRANFRLTAAGRQSFAEWLTDRQDRERAEVVVRILTTTMFTSAQRDRLYYGYEQLRPHRQHTSVICHWMADNLPSELFRTCSAPDRLSASYELLRTIMGES